MDDNFEGNAEYEHVINKETLVEHIEIYDEDAESHVPAILMSTTDIDGEIVYTIFDYDSLVSAVAELIDCKEYLESFLED